MVKATKEARSSSLWAEMKRSLQSPAEAASLDVETRRMLLENFEKEPSLRKVRALALYHELRRYGDTATQKAWQGAGERVGLTPGEIERAIGDLVGYALAGLSFRNRRIILSLFVEIPELDGADGDNEGSD